MPADRPTAAPSAAPRVAVVGGGVSGLVAARELVRGGAEVVLLEAESELGGRIRGDRVGELDFDLGAEAFATRGGTVAAYLAELGLSDEIVHPRPLGSWVIAEGRALPLPRAGTIGIPAAPLSAASVRVLGLAGALRAAVEPLLPRRIGRDAQNIADLVRSRLGNRVLDRAVRPVVLGVYSTDPADLGLAAMPALREARATRRSLISAARAVRADGASSGSAVAGLRGGMSTLIDALARELSGAGAELRTGVRVDAAERRDDGWRIRCSRAGETDGGEIVEADALLLAVDEAVAMRLADPEHGMAAAPADSEVEVVALVIDDARLDAAPRGTGALVAPGRGDGADHRTGAAPRIAAKALTHATAKWSERARQAGPGRHLVRLSYGRTGDAPATAGLADAALRDLALRDASAILGLDLRPESLVAIRRRRWRTGSPVDPARAQALAPRVSAERLAFAGDWLAGTGLASVIPGAVSAARDLLGALDTRDADGAAHPDPTDTAPAVETAASATPADPNPLRTRGPIRI